ncbi:MAG: cupredoxin domain-containing protein [Acidimicrobiales bacterium]
MTGRFRALLVAGSAALLGAACGADDDVVVSFTPGAVPTTTAPTRDVTVIGRDIAFDVTELDATVGERLIITFENRDAGIAHNLHVTDTAEGDALTDIEAGIVTQSLEVAFDEPGNAEYICDVHPQQMRGTITVSG